MSRTVTLRKQHESLVMLAGEISELSGAEPAQIDVAALQRTMMRFDSLLKTHLSSEDTFLYPQMMASADPKTSTTATEFSREMGGLVEEYLAFANVWSNGEAVLRDLDRFRKDWNAILGALSRRISRETEELYPLADAMD